MSKLYIYIYIHTHTHVTSKIPNGVRFMQSFAFERFEFGAILRVLFIYIYRVSFDYLLQWLRFK
jgi:hypothetical protein